MPRCRVHGPDRSFCDINARAMRHVPFLASWPPHEPDHCMVACAALPALRPYTFRPPAQSSAREKVHAVSVTCDCAGARVGADHSQPTKGPLDARACSRPARHSYRACFARLPRAWQARARTRLFSSLFTVSSRCLTEVHSQRVCMSGWARSVEANAWRDRFTSNTNATTHRSRSQTPGSTSNVQSEQCGDT